MPIPGLTILLLALGATCIGLGHLIPGRGWVIAGTILSGVAAILALVAMVTNV